MLIHRPQTPQLGFGSITLLQKFTPHFEILDPRLQIVEEVWTMTEKMLKSKDLRRQTKEWMAVFSQTVWEILSKKL